MPLINSTIGSPSANSLSALDEALAYFTGRADASAFTDGNEEQQEQWLITACHRLNQEEYVGTKVSRTQALKFPRYDCTNFMNDEWTPSGEIPPQMKRAQFELALHFAKNADALDEDDLKQFDSLALPGGLRFELSPQRTSGELPMQVQRELRGLWLSAPGMLLRS